MVSSCECRPLWPMHLRVRTRTPAHARAHAHTHTLPTLTGRGRGGRGRGGRGISRLLPSALETPSGEPPVSLARRGKLSRGGVHRNNGSRKGNAHKNHAKDSATPSLGITLGMDLRQRGTSGGVQPFAKLMQALDGLDEGQGLLLDGHQVRWLKDLWRACSQRVNHSALYRCRGDALLLRGSGAEKQGADDCNVNCLGCTR